MKYVPKKAVPIEKWPKCRSCRKAPAIYGKRCGHCFAAILKRDDEKPRSSKMVKLNALVAIQRIDD